MSHFWNIMFSMPSAVNETDANGASTQFAVAAACLLLLYASVYTLHFVCVAHISKMSAPPAQTMHTPSPFSLFLAFLCVCAAVPTGAICALCRNSIVWSGIRYSIKDGGVYRVVC